MQFSVGRSSTEQHVVGKEKALPRHVLLAAERTSKRALRLGLIAADDLQHVALPHEDLVHVQQDVTATYDNALDGQVLANVLRLAHFVVHLL